MNDYVLLTDSSADLTDALVKELGVEVLPLSFTMRNKTYRNWPDNREIDPKDFYRQLREGEMATTSAVNVSDFTETIEPHLKEGRDVLVVAFSSGLSATYQNAVIAAQDLPGVYPVDSQQLTTGMGLMVLNACRMRDEGMDAASIAQAMEEMIPRVNVSFVIDTLEYMWKGGRCTGVAAFGAKLLNRKPCIEMRGGKLEVCKKYRGNIEKVYEKYIAERLAGKDVDPARIFVTTSNAPSPELAQRLEDTVRKAVPDVQEVLFTRTGCTVTSHCGPGTMGVLFLEK